MIRTLKESWALFAGILMLMIANGLLSTLLTIRGSSIGFSETLIGLIQAAYPLGALVGCIYAPRLVERVGHVRAFGALASLCSISAIVHLLTVDPWSWSAMRFLAGLCFPGLYVITESWLNAKAENHSRALILSVYFVTQTLGASAGQALAGLNDPDGAMLFGLTSILISLSLVPLLMSRNVAPAYVVPDWLTPRQLARISPMAVSGAVLNGVLQAAFYIALPLYGLAMGLRTPEAAGLLVTGTIAGALAQFPVGWISDRVDRRTVIGGLSLVNMAIALALIAGALDAYLYPAIAAVGALTLPIYSLCVAHANDQLSPSQIVPASGTLVLALNLGVLAGAFAGPAMIGVLGAAGLPMLVAAGSALTALIALVRQIRVPAPDRVVAAQPISVQGGQAAGILPPEVVLEERQAL